MHNRQIGQGRLVCCYFVISFYLLMRGQVSIVQKEFDIAIASDATPFLSEMYTTCQWRLSIWPTIFSQREDVRIS